MKIQSLAVIFIVIILPISLVLAAYTQNRVETINLQTRYDSKLNDATYDALKAYQLNSFNSDSSDYTNSKIRDIKASANTFFNSVSSGFSELGYTKESLQNYVPALVYTMYDGYYIYSPFTNTWDEETKINHGTDPSYSDGKTLYGLKPYVYYSCRYKQDNYNDVTITYSLDNYIQIQGIVGGEPVSKYGYLLDNTLKYNDTYEYKGVTISNEQSLSENVYIKDEGLLKDVPYIKRNGTKYYYYEQGINGTEVFSIINGKIIPQSGINPSEITNNNNAIKYYEEAYNLKNFINGNEFLKKLKPSDIVLEDGTEYNNVNDNTYDNVEKIFDFDNIESETSNFNTHRIQVIKHSIERNLSIAISNFNQYSNVEFQMPKLKDEDWDKIMDNISIISFMQGVNIGGKIYNGYSIITNTKNEDIVMEDSIYMKKPDGTICRITEEGLANENLLGIYNVNLERRSAQDKEGNTVYYFPVEGTLSYNSIVTQDKVELNSNSNKTLKGYMSELNNNNLKKAYYTALARERYGLYRQKLEI